ncbi:response regulator receiver domain-containing protein [Hoeflea marina]|uniref:Response regulator receiver domain-containing protein n=1 Tax=Hoeflea marina TaxID=274592 RepID=A0A317PG67_9HYPH|nr:response regulator [Hoeflea marina]PWV98946.1 response regulator receiver domain-containing protein [Hoeflea marina]
MAGRKSVVLVVEDDTLIRMAAVDLLETAGYDVLEAGTADEAILMLEAPNDIALVFTDVEMPGSMDGMKLCHAIRDRWPPVKLIVASGRQVVEGNQLPSGARFFSKPYRDDTIVAAVGELLAA